MPDKNEAIANAIELLTINQSGIGAAVEEISKWIAERGSTEVHNNVVIALEVLDRNAESINSAIKLLRQG